MLVSARYSFYQVHSWMYPACSWNRVFSSLRNMERQVIEWRRTKQKWIQNSRWLTYCCLSGDVERTNGIGLKTLVLAFLGKRILGTEMTEIGRVRWMLWVTEEREAWARNEFCLLKSLTTSEIGDNCEGTSCKLLLLTGVACSFT